MKKHLLALSVLWLSAAQAQTTEYERMLDAISNSVGGRVLVFAPTILDKRLADTLRQTHLDSIRKTKVNIVTIPYFNYLAKSTVLSLAMATVPVFEVQTPVSDGVVIVDDMGWKGTNLGKLSESAMQRLTPKEINSMLIWFKGTTTNNRRLTQYDALKRSYKVLK